MGSVRAQVAVQDLQQNPPPADEPPVDVLHPAVFRVVLALQISNPTPEGSVDASGAEFPSPTSAVGSNEA